VQQGAAYLDAKKQGAVLGWGNFITVAINFVIIAFVLFLVIRALNRFKLRNEPVAQVPADVVLLTEIRDLLAAREAPR
jgi:large conductance mechanosensitive channel